MTEVIKDIEERHEGGGVDAMQMVLTADCEPCAIVDLRLQIYVYYF